MKKVSVKMGKYELLRLLPEKFGTLQYLFSVFSKYIYLQFIILIPIVFFFISRGSIEEERFVYIYIGILLLWGMLMIRMILYGVKSLPKGKFDIYFLLFITTNVLSSLFSQNQESAIFGSDSNWIYTILTMLSIFIIYYYGLTVFGYRRGSKWILFSIVLGALFGGVFNLYYLLKQDWSSDIIYYEYIVYVWPLLLTLVFYFKNRLARFMILVATLINLVLLSFRLESIALWSMGVGVVVLLLLVYFYIWVKNLNKIKSTAAFVIKRILRKKANKNKSLNFELILIVLGLGLLIIVVGFFVFRNIQDIYNEKSKEIDNFIMFTLKENTLEEWIVGENDIDGSQPSIFLLALLKNFGILSLFIWVLMALYGITLQGRKALKMFNSHNMVRAIFESTLFVSLVALLANMIIGRLYSLTLVLYVLLITYLAIRRLNVPVQTFYKMGNENKLGIKRTRLIIKSIIVLIIIGVVVLGISQLLNKLDTA